MSSVNVPQASFDTVIYYAFYTPLNSPDAFDLSETSQDEEK